MSETEQNGDIPPDLQEKRHFQRVINAFRYYRSHSIRRLLVTEKYYHDLPLRHRQLMPEFLSHLKIIRTCIDHNYEIIKLIINNTDHMFENKDHGPVMICKNGAPASEFDMDKVRTTLKQFVRDWSDEGQSERDSCYRPVLDQIQLLFPPEKYEIGEVSVLVPGAGLGRLAFEIARLGYCSQGNEFSLFMLFASNFILNRCQGLNSYTIYPWIHQFCNNYSGADQVRPVTFPDVSPMELSGTSHFSMAAGDFLEIYTEPDQWDCVSTVFFIDTAHNIIAYIETIYKILKPGGYWINLGPLLYHFADVLDESSIELGYQELKTVITKLNFTFVSEELRSQCSYVQNPRSMLTHSYDCVLFVCRKPLTS